MISGLIKSVSNKGSVRNVIWNFIGTLLTGSLLVFATPIYVKRLGLEGYGIIGLWSIMQVLMGLLDMGFGATLVREFASSGQTGDGVKYRRDILKTIERVCWTSALVFAFLVVLSSGWIAGTWLKSQSLPIGYVTRAIQLMAIAMALQFPWALYSSGLCGLQEQGKMNLVKVVSATARYGVGVAILLWKADLKLFFIAQAVVASLQTFVARGLVWRMISPSPKMESARFQLRLLKNVSRFSMGMAINTILGILLGSTDRILLSGRLEISELGRYSVAFTAANMLQLGIQPFYNAFFPRYAELFSKSDPELIEAEYFQSNKLMAIAILPICIVMLVFAPQIFWAWFGKNDVVMVSVFRWLAVGMTGAGVTWLPAAFQQAYGWTRLHVGMMASALLIGYPLTLWAINHWGTPGATAVWVVHGLLDLTIGLWFMHRRLLKGLLLAWYREVLLPPMLIGIPVVGLSRMIMLRGLSRSMTFIWVLATGLIVVIICLGFYFKNSRDGRFESPHGVKV